MAIEEYFKRRAARADMAKAMVEGIARLNAQVTAQEIRLSTMRANKAGVKRFAIT